MCKIKKITALILIAVTVILCAACSKPTEGQQAALDRAREYADNVTISEGRLRDQLKSEQFSDEDIEYALKKLDVNWYDAAASRAQSYVEYFGLGEAEIREQLEFEQYSYDQIEYAIRKLKK